jgi:hypothetical protein
VEERRKIAEEIKIDREEERRKIERKKGEHCK